MCVKQEFERLQKWVEKERCGSEVMPRARTEESEVKVKDEALVDRWLGQGVS